MEFDKDYNELIKAKALEKRREILLGFRVQKRSRTSPFRRLLSRRLSQFVNATAFNYFIALLIIFSVALIFAEIFVPYGNLRQQISLTSNIITWIFVFELSLRFIAAPNRNLFFGNYWIDIIAVLPAISYFQSFRVLSLLRLLRVFRALLIFARQSGFFSNRVGQRIGNFGVLFFSAIFLVLCGTLALVVSEKSIDPTLQDFASNFWSSIFLFVSGELVRGLPNSLLAKFISVLITISGMVVFAVLVGTISASMAAFFRARTDVKDLEIEDLNEHILICGWDRMGGLILSELECVPEIWQRGVVVISETVDNILDKSPIANSRRLFHVKQDFTKIEVLESVGARRASAAIVLADKGNNLGDQDRDARTVLAALTLEKLNPKIYTCAEILDDANRLHLRMAGVEEIISRTNITAGLFASTLINRGVSSVVSDILSHKEGTYLKKVPSPKEFNGKPFLEVFSYFKKTQNSTVLSVMPKGTTTQEINPSGERIMNEGDTLLVVAKVNS